MIDWPSAVGDSSGMTFEFKGSASGADIRFDARRGGGDNEVNSGSGSGGVIVCIFGVGNEGETGEASVIKLGLFSMNDDFSVCGVPEGVPSV